MSLTRNVINEVEVDGQILRAGERVLLWLPGANHSESVFASLGTIDLDRASCPHTSYGNGPQFCLGTTLTRLESTLVLE